MSIVLPGAKHPRHNIRVRCPGFPGSRLRPAGCVPKPAHKREICSCVASGAAQVPLNQARLAAMGTPDRVWETTRRRIHTAWKLADTAPRGFPPVRTRARQGNVSRVSRARSSLDLPSPMLRGAFPQRGGQSSRLTPPAGAWSLLGSTARLSQMPVR